MYEIGGEKIDANRNALPMSLVYALVSFDSTSFEPLPPKILRETRKNARHVTSAAKPPINHNRLAKSPARMLAVRCQKQRSTITQSLVSSAKANARQNAITSFALEKQKM